MQPTKGGNEYGEHKGRKTGYEAGCTRAHSEDTPGQRTRWDGGDPGLYPTGGHGAGRPGAKSTARKSTGINPQKRNPIDSNSPNLPPN